MITHESLTLLCWLYVPSVSGTYDISGLAALLAAASPSTDGVITHFMAAKSVRSISLSSNDGGNRVFRSF